LLDTTGTVVVEGASVTLHWPRRAHNPLLIESGLVTTITRVSWWGGATLEVAFP
jgi:hypothetical protein